MPEFPNVPEQLAALADIDDLLRRHAVAYWLFGGWAVLLAIPLAAVLATLVSVVVLEKDPADEEVPTVLFPAKDVEG